MKKALGFCLLAFVLLTACSKNSFITSPDAKLSTSVDTLKFDTVFTTVGSVTKLFKVFNDNNQKLRLNSIALAGGTASPFKININGTAATQVNNIELEANDSLYVFVQVNINPETGNLPFVVSDSIEINYNGNTRKVQLQAWGQNAHFMRDREVASNETWNNDLPYVILGYLYVHPQTQLTINKGTRVYFHADAPAIIDGTLQVNGDVDTADRVYFQGDRLDEPYNIYPAAWPGIYFRSSSINNRITYGVVNNAHQALALEGPATNGNPKLVLQQTVVHNAYDAGILAVNSSVQAVNSLITNSGRNIVLSAGGNYQFTHCTVASYGNNFVQHNNPVLQLSNSDGVNHAALQAVFTNCIFWGEGGVMENEVLATKNNAAAFNVQFNNVLWKMKTVPAEVSTTGNIITQKPEFDSINTSRQFYNFRLKNISPAIGSGSAGTIIDLDGKTRGGLQTDLGCFEKQ
ncbi:hypothetical protein ACFS6H_03025 [Terrimonas rubra]|uniref:Right handed beta helix region n=1 Tax=Terrimonas rubra TaxID=1035890 RepID=A0ABW6A0A3_9BACT